MDCPRLCPNLIPVENRFRIRHEQMMPTETPRLFAALSALGAGEFSHLNGSLERHLVAVHDLLGSWGAGETLCRAGLFHAAYGTAGFTAAMVTPSQRSEIAKLIGPDAERIVYLYCSCDREFVWPQIGKPEAVHFRDRFTGKVDAVAYEDLADFCELTCANELEIASGDHAFVERAGDYLGHLFRAWDRLLSEPARHAVGELLPAS